MNHPLHETSTPPQTDPPTNINPAPVQTSITFNRLKHLQSLIKEEAASRELCTPTLY